MPNVSISWPKPCAIESSKRLWGTFRNFNEIISEIKTGILRASKESDGNIAGIAVDSWGVDFGLIDDKGNLVEKLCSFDELWAPKIVGELNGQYVKVVKFQGEYVWHHHDSEDELWLRNPKQERKRPTPPLQPLFLSGVMKSCPHCEAEVHMESFRDGKCTSCQIMDFLV